MPSTRPEFWTAKIGKNREIDHRANERLIDAGWRVAIVWECALKGRGAIPPETLIARLCTWLRSDDSSLLVLSANQRGEAE
jgi:DNA mismatch endonuclease (patch repair protein)